MPTNKTLSNLPVDTLKAIARELQDAVESKLKGTDHKGLSTEISMQSHRLRCRSQEWHSNAFFVIVVGPVKSGKSTFVNLLAHEKVSPTHYLECTVRPSIISRKKDEKADSQIIPFITEGTPTIEHVDAIIDYVKGLDYADLNHVKKGNPCVLNNENLDKINFALDLKDEGKIAITAITAKGGEFLQDNIYLIDMPGFDGVMANLDASFYGAIVNRADLVVFVQSSNSAINKISEDFCRMIQKRNDSVPIYFVHNYFDSSYWHTKEERDRVTEGHIEKAMRFFEEHKLPIKSKDDIFRINLGKVTDARDASFMGDAAKFLSKYKDELLQEEKLFVEMERVLHEKICSSQSRMRLVNCINRTVTEAALLLDLLNRQKSTLDKAQTAYDSLNKTFDEIQSHINAIEVKSILNMTDRLSGLIAQLKGIKSETVRNIGKEDKYDTDSVRTRANNLIGDYVNMTKSYIDSWFHPQSILDMICLRSYEEFLKAIPQSLKVYNRLLEKILMDDSAIDIDYSSIYGKYLVKDRIKRKLLFGRYNGGEVVGIMSDIEHELFGLSPEHACGYIPQQFFPGLCKGIEDWIGARIKDFREKYLEKVEEERIKALKEIIPDMASHTKQIKLIQSYIEGLEGICNKINN